MNESELLRKVALTFEKLQIPYFVTGGMASIAYGEPRFTSDIDVVADIPERSVANFLAEYPFPEFYLSEVAVRSAIAQRFQFNILHPSSGLKVDVILPKRTEFDRERMSRIVQLDVGNGLRGWFASPEDVILKKLVFYREGESEKHLRDIASMLLIRRERIDRSYISDWAEKLGVSAEWELIRNRADQATS